MATTWTLDETTAMVRILRRTARTITIKVKL